MIIVEPCAGLGNRFLGMASAYHWAQQTGDELTVLWKTERVMGARNEAVFSLPDGIRVIHAKDFGYKDKPFSHFRYQMLEKKLRKKADYFSDVDMTNDLFVEKGNAYYEEVMKNNDLKFIRAFSQFHDFSGIDRPLEFIKPTDYVREKADSVISGVDSSSNIGVHIRRTDNQVCINNSPLEVFIEAMEKEIEKDDRVTFYIASDDLDTILELKRRFGDRNLRCPRCERRRDDYHARRTNRQTEGLPLRRGWSAVAYAHARDARRDAVRDHVQRGFGTRGLFADRHREIRQPRRPRPLSERELARRTLQEPLL